MLQYMTYMFGQISDFIPIWLGIMSHLVHQMTNLLGQAFGSVLTWFGTVMCIQRMINDLYIGTNFWFCPSLAWYCNMYPTGKLSIATNDLPVGYTIVNY
ncbi:hypothetical protein H5410_003675 [Solanum commersonii]|uniref:Uncharacterized protein n=1 Tax=Solanum commersonii TaxID=4109 RepID=A0A9J6B5E2_SOLCO|nr:hypothetical protein H5410_003675 [Solanum commersonii]